MFLLVIFGSFTCVVLCYFHVYFSSCVEAPIKTEADILAEDQVLHSSAPEKPSQDANAAVQKSSEAKCESRRRSFKNENPKRKKKDLNYRTLFEPRTHHPYLLEMVRGLCVFVS